MKKLALWGSVASIIGLVFSLYPFLGRTETTSGSNQNVTAVGDGSTAVGTNTGTVNVNSGNVVNYHNAKPHIPAFEGEIGQFEKSGDFQDFIFNNQRKTVLIDAYYVPDDLDELQIVNNTFGVGYFHLWGDCFEPLDPYEKPSSVKCTGTSYSLDRSGPPKDADITYIRGAMSVQGYFAVRGCGGPHQGSMGCTLRPLNPEDVR